MLRRATTAICALGLVATAAACASGQAAGGLNNAGSSTASAKGTATARAGWADYFFPDQAGYSCTYTVKGSPAKGAKLGVSASGRGVQKVVSVRSDAGSRVYTTEDSGNVTSTAIVDGVRQKPVTARPNLEHDYRITPDGTLVSLPPKLPSIGPFRVAVSGSPSVPSIELLHRGVHRDVTATVSLTATDARIARALQKETTDSSSTLRVTLTLRATGYSPGRVTVAGTTYPDTVGTHVRAIAKSVNLPKGNEFQKALDSILGTAFPDVESVYARGRGPVVSTIKSAAGSIRSEATHCGR